MIRTSTSRRAACAATLSLVAALLSPLDAQAQISVGNSVFPSAGDTLHYALDRSPGPAIQVTNPGSGWTWDFSSLAWHATWIETLRPAATGTGAEFFGGATLVYTQTGPASVNFPLLPGSNGSEAYLQVTDSAVKLLGFHGGSDAGHLGVGAFVTPQATCAWDANPTPPDLRTAFLTRYDPLELTWAPKNFFDIRAGNAGVIEEYPATDIPGLSNVYPFTYLRICAGESSVTIVNASGTLLLPGGSFEVLREATRSFVELRLHAYVPPLGWLDVTDIAVTALPDVRWGTWEQYTYRYFDADSKESLATTYSPIALYGQADPSAIEQVRFKNLAAVPEPETATLLLVGVIGLIRLGRKARARARVTDARPSSGS